MCASLVEKRHADVCCRTEHETIRGGHVYCISDFCDYLDGDGVLMRPELGPEPEREHSNVSDLAQWQGFHDPSDDTCSFEDASMRFGLARWGFERPRPLALFQPVNSGNTTDVVCA